MVEKIQFKNGKLPFVIHPYNMYINNGYVYFTSSHGPYKSKYIKSIVLREYVLDVRNNSCTDPALISGADKWSEAWPHYSTLHYYYNKIYHVYCDKIIRETTVKNRSTIRTKHHLIITP